MLSYVTNQRLASLTLWRPLLPYGTAIKHPERDRVKPSFVILTSGHSNAQPWSIDWYLHTLVVCPQLSRVTDILSLFRLWNCYAGYTHAIKWRHFMACVYQALAINKLKRQGVDQGRRQVGYDWTYTLQNCWKRCYKIVYKFQIQRLN